MSFPMFAKNALEMISKVSIPATDENLAAVAQTRTMLHNIANGTLVVVAPPKVEAAPEKTKGDMQK